MVIELLMILLAEQQQGEWQGLVTILGSEPYSSFSSLASLADLDGDGCAEILVGDYNSDVAGLNVGAAYVFSGRSGRLLYSYSGESSNSFFGQVVSSAGDIDADGFGDFLISAPSNDNLGISTGAVYVYSGRTGALVYRLLPAPGSHYRYGNAISEFGDMNHDGYADVLVGEPSVPRAGGSGTAWLYSGRDGSILAYFGSTGQFGVGGFLRGIPDVTGDGEPDLLTSVGSANASIALISGASGLEIRRHASTTPHSLLGNAMASLGDIDLDGVADYALGDAATSTTNGWVFVFSGASGTELLSFEGANGAEFGNSVAGAGDVDGDGYPDILVGAPYEPWWKLHGAAYLYSGFDGTQLMRFYSDSPRLSIVGVGVAGMGDMSGDGLADFALVGRWLLYSGATYSVGAVRIYSLRSHLQIAPNVLSAAAGGTIAFALDFPDSDAGRAYRIFASSGTGRTRVDGWWLPLARSPLLTALAHSPPPGFQGSTGTLDAAGDAAATLALAPSEAAAFAGRTIKWAAVTFDAAGKVAKFSAAMPLTVGP